MACEKCPSCAWENLLPEHEPCKSCFSDDNWEPKTPAGWKDNIRDHGNE